MKKYGYDKDSGILMSLDSDFWFEGKTLSAPEGSFISEDREVDEMTGCAFLSGWSGTFMVLKSDGTDEKHCVFGWETGKGHWKGNNVSQDDLRKLSTRMPICVCGSVVLSPEAMGKLCSRFPNSRMYACPIVEELAAFGVLVRNAGKRPYRAALFWDNKDTIDAEFQTYDPVLEGDSMGRMADVITAGLPAVNEVMKTIGVSPFYGRTLHKGWIPGSQIIVRTVDMDSLFPISPISAKNYVATSVPVKMETTEQFRELTGYNEPFADVFVSTDYIPGLSTFMRFFKTLSGRGFVFTSKNDKKKHGPIVPVFRGDKVYRVLKEKYE